jgi:ATP-dependent Lon protease
LVEYLAGNNQPIKYRILMMDAPIKIKSVALSKLKNLSELEKSSPDYAYEWTSLNYLLDLPWNRSIDLPVTKQSGLDAIQSYLKNAMDFLETVTYGQYRAKSTLLLKLARYLENPESSGFILGIKGPPGSGKTTLVNNGLSRLLNRPFFRVDLGGAKHADSLLGTRKVFERSDVGDLTRFLIEGKCMNPVIFFDELDKVSTTDYGREIIDTLNDLTDKTRNKTIVDQYLGLSLDFSKAIYVFAYNSSDQIPESLMSRIHEIEIEPYTVTDKIEMCSKFFLPKACANLNFDQKLVSFEPSALKWLIAQQKPPELGARELERSIENIIEKLCWSRLTIGHELNDYHCDGLDNLTFPVKINLKLMKSLHSTFSLS